jgi:hypothetical protein
VEVNHEYELILVFDIVSHDPIPDDHKSALGFGKAFMGVRFDATIEMRSSILYRSVQ